MKTRFVAFGAAITLMFATGLIAAGKPAASPAPASPAVATIGTDQISAADLEEASAAQLFKLKNDEYNTKMQVLYGLIGDKLLEKEAAARKMSVDDLVKQEILDKVTPVTDQDVQTTYDRIKDRYKDKSESELKEAIQAQLRQQAEGIRRSDYLKELHTKAGVKILLEPPRVAVADGGSPSKGPKTAAVTIIEFSDFQCPYCSRVEPTLKQLQDKYGDKIRIVFRDYPLPMHAQAPKAAEAGACADDQGKFWEMHDKMFSNQQRLQVADLKTMAGEIGLDTKAFEACLDSGKKEADWRKDMADGNKNGVSSTPAFFINGRSVVGAAPLDQFTLIIDEELERAKVAQAK
jgi:protein-disulfide isomerase